MENIKLVKKRTVITEFGFVSEEWEIVSESAYTENKTILCTITRKFDPVAAAYGVNDYRVYDATNKEHSFSVKELLHMQEIIDILKKNYSDLRAISDIWNQTKTPEETEKFPLDKNE